MKGQISSIDVTIAVVLFLFLYSILAVSFYSIETKSDDFNELSLIARQASSQLLNSQGEPRGWTTANVQQLGIASERGVIEPSKLSNFLNFSIQNVEQTKWMLGIAGLNWHFQVSQLNGTTLQVNSSNYNGPAELGSEFNSTPSVATRSIAVYNNSRVFVNFKIGR